jgi:hypothetical protein
LQRKGFEKTKFFLTLKTSKACFLRQGKGKQTRSVYSSFANQVCKAHLGNKKIYFFITFVLQLS